MEVIPTLYVTPAHAPEVPKYETSDRVFLVYNHWEWKPRAVLSLLIRIFTYGPNHCAILKDGYVHEMVGSGFGWSLKKLIGQPVSYAANHGCGYKVTPYQEWWRHTSRKVVEMKPRQPLRVSEVNEGYGFLDLLQIFFHIIRTKWFLIGHKWNGRSGTRIWPGVFCSEYVGRWICREDAHILTPADLQFVPELEYVREFETFKTKANAEQSENESKRLFYASE